MRSVSVSVLFVIRITRERPGRGRSHLSVADTDRAPKPLSPHEHAFLVIPEECSSFSVIGIMTTTNEIFYF